MVCVQFGLIAEMTFNILTGLSSADYNGLVVREIPDGPVGDRIGVFVYGTRSTILVRPEKLDPATPREALDAAIQSLAKDDYLRVLKCYTKHNNFYEGGPAKPPCTPEDASSR